LWSTYSKVNLLFKNKIIEVYNSHALIWIHGFHLMLLPGFVRRVSPGAKIGFFFHTPFPSSEIWRTMVHRTDLLYGLLNADQIGFHLYEYARHFLTTCRRLLGYRYDFILIIIILFIYVIYF
jgi:trehalose 6-phosphate synthase/phosphatase